MIVRSEQIVAGPAQEVLKIKSRGGTGSLTTSALALGASRSTLRALRDELRQTLSLEFVVSKLSDEGRVLEQALFAASREEPGAWSVEQIRLRANSYVTRLAQSFLAAAKGTGFVSGHPAERAIREAMFFTFGPAHRPWCMATCKNSPAAMKRGDVGGLRLPHR